MKKIYDYTSKNNKRTKCATILYHKRPGDRIVIQKMKMGQLETWSMIRWEWVRDFKWTPSMC